MRVSLLLMTTILVACVTPRVGVRAAETYTNMPAACIGVSTDLNGKPMSACPSGNHKFVRATPEAWVRVCEQASDELENEAYIACTYQTFVWRRWAQAKDLGAVVEVCTVAKESGAPAAGAGASCSTTGSGYGGMKQVPASEVREVPPLPASSLTVSPTTGPAPLNVTLTWNVPGMPQGTPCQAQSTGLTSSKPGAWSGPKTAVGSEQINSLMESTRFTLSCVYSKNIAVVVSWRAPSSNVDGSPVTDIAGYTVVYGQSPQELVHSANAAANVSSLLVQNSYFKADQTWWFAVKAFTSSGNHSDPSNLTSLKLVPPGGAVAPFSGSVTATVTGTIPNAPTDASAQQIDAPEDTGQIIEPPEVKQRTLQRPPRQ